MSIKQVQLLLLFLGYSPGNPDGIDGPTTRGAVRQFQQDFGGLSVDGLAGEETQKALKHAVAYGSLKRENATATENATGNATSAKNPDGWPAKHFDRTEFRCPCGKCGGFPVEPQTALVLAADEMREDFGTAVIIVPPDGHSGGSGVRCQAYNDSLSGSVPNSRHCQGKAIDFRAPGQTTARVEAYLAKLKAAGTIRYWYRITPGSWHMDIL